MRKINKSVFRIDYQMDEAAEYFNNLLFEKGITTAAKEETRKKYGFYTVYVVAATQESAIRKFEREFLDEVNNNGLTWMTIETVICGATF
jgi:hypothetical protein